VFIRPGLGLDDWISVRGLADDYDLIKYKAAGKQWIVGTEDAPLATFSSKEEVIDKLVTNPDYSLLGHLRTLLVKTIREDHSGRFNFELDDAERAYVEGMENDDEDADISKKFVVNADDDEDEDVLDS